MKKPTILLTGGTGLLGVNLIPSLLAKDFTIVCLFRTKNSIEPIQKHSKVTFLSYQEFFDAKHKLDIHIDIVLHCAGLVSYNKKDKAELFEVNEELTEQLASWAINEQISHFIYISSIAALGRNTINSIITENTPISNKDFITNYGLSKRAGELAVKKLGHKGLNWTILSPSVILGLAPLHKSSAQLVGYVVDEKPFYTSGTLNFVDIRDVCQLIIKCIQSPKVHEHIIISGGSTTYKVFFDSLAKALGKKKPFIMVPNWALLVGAISENLWSRLVGKKPLLSKETAKMAGHGYIYSNAKSKKIFEHEYYSLEETINFLKLERENMFP